jgi:hypothetical protein
MRVGQAGALFPPPIKEEVKKQKTKFKNTKSKTITERMVH